MQEPLTKDLGFGISARLDADGSLTLTEVQSVPAPESLVMDGPEEEEVVTTTMQLPAQAVRGLLNMLLTEIARTILGYRKGQGHRPQGK